MNERSIHPGYWEDANGALIPTSKIKEIDKDRHRVVTQLVEQAKVESSRLVAFKVAAMQAVNDFVERSLAAYEVKHGGKKGNVTLVTFDGRYKIVRQMQESITFDERLQAAKALIDECIQSWSKSSNVNLKVLVNDAFQVDQQGKISTGRVLGLRRHDIDDEKWQLAMKAIGDSMQVASTKPYIRFYERDPHSGDYFPISLDVAAV
ncbi:MULTISPECIES: DUF3164 family protein [unclassified Variovorax]|jgi:hypothetical protein|uniref:DUF3164 family protein n=1 Tax=unclassified Variovorax TaxID=663243 RepID=UPI000F7DE675|nr:MULTISPECIES: DUF3164 family protein [unclassified Variovorax]RSZ35104.1 DUF3164 family protein [Variovorax sp. 553]RSZ35878.1 DUF3164 family protein [Variovorax sp. 679]